MGADPPLGGRMAFVEEAPGGLPQVLEHVDDVDHDGHVHAAGAGFGVDAVDLVGVAVDQGDPAAPVGGVAAVASSNTWPMTAAASWATLAVSHLPRAVGPGWPRWRSSGVAGRMSAMVRGAGVVIHPGFPGGSIAWKAGWSHGTQQEHPPIPEALPARAA